MTADRFRDERERLKWNQETVAAICGCTRRTVVSWEAGDGSPKAEHLTLLSERGFDVYYVLTGLRIGEVTTLTAQESALVNAYRAAADEGKRALETTSAALARVPTAGIGAGNAQINVGTNHGQVVDGSIVNNGPVSIGKITNKK